MLILSLLIHIVILNPPEAEKNPVPHAAPQGNLD
jgi:hypothetical protein